MTKSGLIEKIDKAIEKAGVIIEGALYADNINGNGTVYRIYDMSITTFNRQKIGVYFASSDKLTLY